MDCHTDQCIAINADSVFQPMHVKRVDSGIAWHCNVAVLDGVGGGGFPAGLLIAMSTVLQTTLRGGPRLMGLCLKCMQSQGMQVRSIRQLTWMA